ncbi:helicase associated domain-containing protein [Streptomyces acidiscabies]
MRTHPRHHTPNEEEKPKPRRTQATNGPQPAAAKQYYQREGHLRVAQETRRDNHRRQRQERRQGGPEERELRLGAWINNQRSRAATLTPERIQQLTTIGMRWT